MATEILRKGLAHMKEMMDKAEKELLLLGVGMSCVASMKSSFPLLSGINLT